MSKETKPGKSKVELAADPARPSRIRRDPPPRAAKVKEAALVDISERETRAVVLGVLLFALAITIVVFGAGNYLSR